MPGMIDESGAAATTLDLTPALHQSVQTELLRGILTEARADLIEIGVSDAAGRELVLERFPVTGSRRVLVYRTGNGFDTLAVPTAGQLVFPANEGRLGLTLVNSGANPIILYLSDQRRYGVPCVWLAASGGAWDGRLGNLAWAGNVYAVAQIGASSLTGGEL